MSNLIDRLNNLDIESDTSVINFIQSIKSSDIDLFTGKNANKEDIILTIIKEGFRVSTHQKNGWIRINEYTIIKNDYSKPELIRSESYEK